MDDILREYIKEALLDEYVVPMGYSLERWLKKKEKERLSNKEYAEETKGDRWKVVHGKTRPKRKGKRKQRLKATKRGEPITKSSKNLSYKRATDLHTAIKLTESPDMILREMMRRQKEIDLIVENLTDIQIRGIASKIAEDNPQAEIQFIVDQAEKLSKRANAMAAYHQGYSGRRDLDAGYLLQTMLNRAVKNPTDYSLESLESGERETSTHYGYKPKDWDAYQDIDPETIIRLRQQEDQTADWTPTGPTPEDIALQGSTVVAPSIDDTAAMSEIYRKFGIL